MGSFPCKLCASFPQILCINTRKEKGSYSFSDKSILSFSVCLLHHFSIFTVPPDPVVIFDETGKRRASVVGPYLIGHTIRLVCDAFGGEQKSFTVSPTFQTNYLFANLNICVKTVVENDQSFGKMIFLNMQIKPFGPSNCKVGNTD